MKKIDYRFDEITQKNIGDFIGKRMNEFACDRLPNAATTAYGAVVLSIGNQKYALTNYLESINYINRIDDVAIFKFNVINDEEKEKIFNECEPIKSPVNQVVKSIKIVNERQQLYKNNVLEYDIYTVRGIIFVFEDSREIAFEKDIWFSEFIDVKTGYNLSDTFNSLDEFYEEWEDSIYEPRAYREVIEL